MRAAEEPPTGVRERQEDIRRWGGKEKRGRQRCVREGEGEGEEAGREKKMRKREREGETEKRRERNTGPGGGDF